MPKKGKVIKAADKTGDLPGVPNNTDKKALLAAELTIVEEIIQELLSLKQYLAESRDKKSHKGLSFF